MRIKSSLLETDIAVYYFMNRRLHGRVVVTFMRGITLFGETYAAVGVGLLALLLGWVSDTAVGVHATLVIGISQVVVQSVKRLVHRTRPYVVHEWSLTKNPPACQYSFPSGHTACAFAWTLVLGLFYPHLQPLLYPLAFLVGMSRVVLGFHYLTDVLVGAAISYGTYILVTGVL
ncbi:MAG: Major phosphate-irrepressible acid phosphatase [Firmicutes bacterium]|nr:Major phosphate-irrepressible acid phosphatase [candidate division NPL-UPA2 bacterium]